MCKLLGSADCVWPAGALDARLAVCHIIRSFINSCHSMYCWRCGTSSAIISNKELQKPVTQQLQYNMLPQDGATP